MFDYQISTPDLTTSGTKQVEVSYTYEGVTKTDYYTINIYEPEPVDQITDIQLSGDYQTEFTQNDEFTYAGLVVIAIHSIEDPTILDESEYTVSEPDMSVVGPQEVTVTFNAISFITASYTITISEPEPQDEITSISLSGDYQTNFTVNDPFSYEGLIVTAHHTIEADSILDDGDFTVSSPDMSVVGPQEVTVSLNIDPSITASYTIYIIEDVDDHDSIGDLIAGIPYSSDGVEQFCIKGTVTCIYLSNGQSDKYDVFIQNKKDNYAIYIYRALVNPEVGSLVEVSGAKNSNVVTRYNGTPEIYGYKTGDYAITITELASARDNTEAITPYISSASEWIDSTSTSSDIYVYAAAHGPLQYKFEGVSITPDSGGKSSTAYFDNGNSGKLYYGSLPETDDIHSKISQFYNESKKVDIIGYLTAYQYSSYAYTQLLVKHAADISETEGQVSSGENLTIRIGSVNDFHGAIPEDTNEGEMGLAKVGTILKSISDEDNALIVDQGDDWQGSIYSNYNHGQLVNDVFAYAHMDARVVGNHDFDWGVQTVINNTARAYNGYCTPVLAANVYDFDFDTKDVGNVQQSNIGIPSVSYTLANGLKVGIVGTIGEDQITSINSMFTHDITFTNHINAIKSEATKLRNQENCDVVIALVHAGQEDVVGNGLGSYVDLVLCGHTHKYQHTTEGKLHYAQFGKNGRYVGDIELTYNTASKSVTNTTFTTYDASNYDTYFGQVDSNIQSLINTYNAQCNAEANVVVANNVQGTFTSNNSGPDLMCKAIYDQCVNEGYGDVIFSYCNYARSDLNSGTWTYADLYSAFPFDNTVFIYEAYGTEILSRCKNNNYLYYNPSFDHQIDPSRRYKIAVLDYVLYHTNTQRYYDWFTQFDDVVVGHLRNNYRIILRDWLINNGYANGLELSYTDYLYSNNQFKRSLLEEIIY